jgi:site-specific recombinase XerD
MVNDSVLFKLIHDYFTLYLPKVRSCSPHTIRSYRSAINSFLDFIKKKRSIQLRDITFDMLNSEILTEYLESLRQNGNNESTRSLRLTCIKAFFSYAADIEPTAVVHEKDISKIKVKGGLREKIRMIDYLSETAIGTLLRQPDALTPKGVRDRFLLTLMYDTGARLAEIRGLRLCDIKNSKTTDIVVNGKGNKIRSIPLMPPTVEHMKHYMSIYHPNVKFGRDNYSHEPLFYIERHGRRFSISDSAVSKVIRRNSKSCSIRRSKAVFRNSEQ